MTNEQHNKMKTEDTTRTESVVNSNIAALKEELDFPSGDYSDPQDSFWQNAYDELSGEKGYDHTAFTLAWQQGIKTLRA